MSQDTLPYPPQMRNGGSPPAHLSSSYLSNPSWWLKFKWSQPPPRAPEWLFDYYKRHNNVTLLRTETEDAFGPTVRNLSALTALAQKSEQEINGLMETSVAARRQRAAEARKTAAA